MANENAAVARFRVRLGHERVGFFAKWVRKKKAFCVALAKWAREKEASCVAGRGETYEAATAENGRPLRAARASAPPLPLSPVHTFSATPSILPLSFTTTPPPSPAAQQAAPHPKPLA
eukprot:2121382-Pleurochrysis_carterae.AAC.3